MGNIIDFAKFKKTGSAIRVFCVRGTGMIPSYRPGDRALVDTTQRQFTGDAVYIVGRDGDLVLTRLQKLLRPGEQRVRIIPDNPRFPVQVVSLQEITIHGRVVGPLPSDAEQGGTKQNW